MLEFVVHVSLRHEFVVEACMASVLLHDRGFRLGVTDFRETFRFSRSSTPAIRTVSPSTTAGDEVASAARTSVSLITVASLDDGRALLERAGGSQPADRRLAHAIGPGQIGLHSALRELLQHLSALVGRQLLRAAEFHAAGLGALAAVLGTRGNQRAFELGETSKHCEHQASVRRCGVGPGILERAEASNALADLI